MLTILTNIDTKKGGLGWALDGCRVVRLGRNEGLRDRLGREGFDLVLHEGDLGVIGEVRRSDPRVEVIVVGAEPERAEEAVRLGASAYLPRPVNPVALKAAIDRIVEVFATRRETAELERLLHAKYTFEGIAVGRNPKMLEVFALMRRIAPYYRTVLVTGETGTGKEVIAKVLHAMSPRRDAPFLVANCGGLNENLIGSELFGHARGAFTGAAGEHEGLFAAAGGGVVFLDEIGELPLAFQPHLLRVLQDGEFRPVGSTQARQARCAVIAATNRDLAYEVSRGRFRKDLYYRLTPFTVHLPPLRERKDDIPLLVRFFLERFRERTDKTVLGFSRPAQAALMSSEWPGNARELQNVIEQAAMVTTESFVRPEDLPAGLRDSGAGEGAGPGTLDEVILRHVQDALRHTGGNRSQAAKVLGISRRSLLRKIEKFGIS
jgi:DNA-binding NtrC family response regulator